MKKNNKGFTLMEMLIVVAIIAVLVAIAIPTFTSALEKSREATDAANLRAAYAEVTVAGLTEAESDTTEGGVKRTGDKDGAYTWTKDVKLVQKQDGWQNKAYTDGTNGGIGGIKAPDVTAGGTVTVTYTQSTGKVSFGPDATTGG